MTEISELAAVIEQMQRRIDYLEDRSRINDVHMRFMRAFDRNDVEALRGTCWPDVQINYGDQINTFDDFVTRHLELHTAELQVWGHLVTNEVVEIDGDVAHTEIYITALFLPRRGAAPHYGDEPLIVGVRYIDRLDRRDGEWRLAVREVVTQYIGASDAVVEHGGVFWGRDDLSYRRPLTRRPGT